VDGMGRYYRPTVFQSLWHKIDDLITDQRMFATEEVQIEIKRKADHLVRWCQERKAMFISIDEEIQPVVSEILATHGRLVKALSNRSAADPFVIALAKVRDAIVVTGERPSGSIDKPRIPDVCDAMGISCMSLVDMMEAEGWSF
jgi:Domain of unknown function (DUF4411)